MTQEGKQSFKIGDIEVILHPERGTSESPRSGDKLFRILADMIASALAYEDSEAKRAVGIKNNTGTENTKIVKDRVDPHCISIIHYMKYMKLTKYENYPL